MLGVLGWVRPPFRLQACMLSPYPQEPELRMITRKRLRCGVLARCILALAHYTTFAYIYGLRACTVFRSGRQARTGCQTRVFTAGAPSACQSGVGGSPVKLSRIGQQPCRVVSLNALKHERDGGQRCRRLPQSVGACASGRGEVSQLAGGRADVRCCCHKVRLRRMCSMPLSCCLSC